MERTRARSIKEQPGYTPEASADFVGCGGRRPTFERYSTMFASQGLILPWDKPLSTRVSTACRQGSDQQARKDPGPPRRG